MKKQKKTMIQLDLWGNKPAKNKLKKFVAFNTERELIVRMVNEAKKEKVK